MMKDAVSDQYSIRAERVDLLSDSGNVIGGYAWWIGDEGVKINVRVGESESIRNLKPGDFDYQKKLGVLRRHGWMPLLGAINASPANDPEVSFLQRMMSLRDLSLEGVYSDESVKRYYHDLTVWSAGVLSNVANGGLKLDLTRILEPGFTATGFLDRDFVFSATPYLPNMAGDYDPPRWGLLRSYYTLEENLTLKEGTRARASVRPHLNEVGEQQHGVFPLIGMVQFNFIARASNTPINPSADPGEWQFPLEILVKPIVVLVNPYDVELEAEDYTIIVDLFMKAIGSTSDYPQGGAGSKIVLAWSNGKRESLNLNDYDDLAPRFNEFYDFGDGFIHLRLSSVTFKPGESKVFTLDPSTYPKAFTPGNDEDLVLVEGYNLQPYAWSTYVAGPLFSPSERDSYSTRVQFVFSNASMELHSSEGLLQRIEHVVVSSSDSVIHPLNNPDGLQGEMDYAWIRLKIRDSEHEILSRAGEGSYTPDISSGSQWLAHSNLRSPISGATPGYLWGYPVKRYGGNPLYDTWRPSGHTIDVGGPYWGQSLTGPETHVVLFHHPRFRPMSIAALQHANISSRSYLPAYAIGNSWASPWFQAGEQDFSYRANSALYDRFFFSTVEADRDSLPDPFLDPLPNARHVPVPGANISGMKSYNQAAANLLVDGSFNVNSTSVEAWKALFRGMEGLAMEYWNPKTDELGVDYSEEGASYYRTLIPGGDAGERWRGFRILEGDEIDALAHEVVDRIRKHGPFMSMADFVNRDLTAPSGSERNLKGILQAAIDATDINADIKDPKALATSRVRYPAAAAGPASTAAPGYLTQADLLQVLDPVMAVRSDTFVIRSYGEARNPLTGQVEAKARCELLVQRLPEYVDTSEHPETWPPQSKVNRGFGRRFVIMGFRWLGENEI